MDGVVLKYYREFSCLADRCEGNLLRRLENCRGSGGVSAVSEDRAGMAPRGHDSHISIKKRAFIALKNLAGGRCAMLDEDGLCRIQRNTSEARC